MVMAKKEIYPEKPEVLAYMVDSKHCKGCKYYGYLGYSKGQRTCEYTYQTGKARTSDTAHCKVKKRK